VKTFGHQFLARPAFADYKDRPVERRCTACPFDAVEKGAGLANELCSSFHHHLLVYFTNLWQGEFNLTHSFTPGKSRKSA